MSKGMTKLEKILLVLLVVAIGVSAIGFAYWQLAMMPAERPTIKIGYGSGIDIGDVAELKGFYDYLPEMGVSTTVTWYASEVAEVPAVLTDDANVINLDFEGVGPLWEEGLDLVVLCSANCKQEWIIVAKDPIKTLQDLEGCTFAIHEWGNLGSLILTEMAMKEVGADPTKVNYVVIEGSTNRAAALLAGTIDATALEVGDVISVMEHPGFNIVAKTGAMVPYLLDGLWVAKKSWIDENPDLAKKFIIATMKSYRWVMDNPEGFVNMTLQYIEVDEDVVRETVGIYIDMKYWDPNGGMSKEWWEKTNTFHVEVTHWLENYYPYEDHVAVDLLEQARNEIGIRP